MARISSYPRDLNIVDADSWIGTSVPGLQTRNFTASAVANYLNLNAKVNIGIIGVSPDSSPERVKKYNDTSEKDNKML